MSLVTHVTVMIAAASVVLMAVLWLLTSEITSPLRSSPDDQTMLEVIRLAFYAVAGIGGVVALTVAYRRQRLNESTEEREQTKLFNERFTAAAEQLASGHAANRLAGVYAVAALADDWDAGRQTCVSVMCAYLRMPYEPPPARENRTSESLDDLQPVLEERLVRHTVADVIGERLREQPVPGKTWHECDFDFTGANLDGGNFARACFNGQVSFAFAKFATRAVNSAEAEFQGPTRFNNITVAGGHVFFDKVRFCNVTVFSDISMSSGGLHFRGTQFLNDTSFARSKFEGGELLFSGRNGGQNAARFERGYIHFNEAVIDGADVSFRNAHFDGATVNMEEVMNWSPLPELLSWLVLGTQKRTASGPHRRSAKLMSLCTNHSGPGGSWRFTI